MPHTIEDLTRRTRHRLAVNARWLLRLRWVAAAGQLITIAVSHWGLGIRLPLAPLAAIIGLTVATNAVLTLAWKQQISEESGPLVESRGEKWLALVMAVDLISLSALLSLTGGLANPFTVFYFVNLTLSTVVLKPRTSWMLTGLAMGSMVAVQLLYRPLPGWRSDSESVDRLREYGALAAFGVCAVVVVYFITRVVNELRRRELELRLSEQERASAERLESLATLAAGAGHELASPLSTIAVIAGDLNGHLEGLDVPDTVRQDVTLIREELDHCRAILHRMSSHAGHDLSEEIEDIGVDELIEQVLKGLRHPEAIHVELPPKTADCLINAPLEGLAQAVRGVVQNGIDASHEDAEVLVNARNDDRWVWIEVRDQGEGMDAATLSRAAEPFFTTKETGNGMGLGLFLTRNVIERLGGAMNLESQPEVGTTVTIQLPLAENQNDG